MIDLEHGFTPVAIKEFVTSAAAVEAATAAGPSNEKEYQDAYHLLRKENEELKGVVAARDVRVRQLESLLASASA